ncbi:hypothetical protein FRC01_005418 [Tulasnella sp. 417]|nr:hypothetical protein FRC01_005418 [Tulasnella sp. 417]
MPILLPKLQSIAITQVPFVSHSRLLDLVEAPNLHRFFVWHDFQWNPFDSTPMFESAGRFIGASRPSRGDDHTAQISIVSTNDRFAAVVGDRRVVLQTCTWIQGTGQGERRAALAAVLRQFDGRLRDSIKVVQLSGLRGREMIDLARVLNPYLPNVEELEMTVGIYSSALEGLSILGQLPSSPAEEKEAWLFPKLVGFKFGVPRGVVCDVILEKLKARNVGQGQAIQLTIQGGKIRRDTADKLRTYLQALKMTGTEVA